MDNPIIEDKSPVIELLAFCGIPPGKFTPLLLCTASSDIFAMLII